MKAMTPAAGDLRRSCVEIQGSRGMEETPKARAHPKSPFSAWQRENGASEKVQRWSSKMKNQGREYRRCGVSMERRLRKEKVGKGEWKMEAGSPAPCSWNACDFRRRKLGRALGETDRSPLPPKQRGDVLDCCGAEVVFLEIMQTKIRNL